MGEIVEFPQASMQEKELRKRDAKLRDMTLTQVRELWDRCEDGLQCDGYWIERIHAELNRRGDGLYCAV